jgi:uncharacterized membrane protein YjjB (DUF3815 family)
MVIAVMSAFLLSLCFSLLNSVPKSELLFAGLSGAISSIVFFYTSHLLSAYIMVPTLLTSAIVTFISRVLAIARKKPVMIFLLPGVITLVPGSDMFRTIFLMLHEDTMHAIDMGLYAIQLGGAIGLGIVFILAVPDKYFSFFVHKILRFS